MKKGIQLCFVLVCVFTIITLWKKQNQRVEKEFKIEEAENESPEKRDEMTQARFQYEFDMLKDPVTGKIPTNVYKEEMKQAMSIPVSGHQSMTAMNGIIRSGFGVNTPSTNVYQAAGPNNVGGRTRALVFDKRYNGTSNKVILAGCVSGGIMRSIDGGNTWTLVTPDQQVHSISCFAQDPSKPDTWYAGTGESFGNSASASGAFYLGNGVFKSVDNGASWVALSSTQQGSLFSFDNVFDLVNRIVVNPANSDVYVACVSTIYRSKDGGTNWSIVKTTSPLGNSVTGNTDIAINKTGTKFYCANHLKSAAADRGVWQSDTGDLNSWTIVGGNVADIPAGWKVNTGTASWGRIVIQLAPSNDNILYVLYENGASQASPSLLPEADFFKLNNTSGTAVWTNLSANMPDMPGGNKTGSDPLAVQGGYDLLLAVNPDDALSVYVGGTNLYRSTSGFTNSSATSWIGGYKTDFSSNVYSNSHPDMHFLTFDPTNSKRAFCCNDGGVQITEDITAPTVVWTFIKNYQTLQYYSVAIDPEIGKNNFVGGAQDNGTWYRDASLNFGQRPTDRPGINDFVNLFGGDGVKVDIAKINAGQQLTYFGAQGGLIVRDELLSNATYQGALIRPKITELTANTNSGYGDFVTNFKLSNSNSEILFYANYNKLFKTNSASSVDSSKWTRLLGVETAINSSGGTSVSIRAMNFSWGDYKTTHAMYIGTNNSKIYRLDDYANATQLSIPVDISIPSLATTPVNIIDIAVNPNDDNEVMAVVSNYNTVSIWWTNNAKSATPSWLNAEGNLTLPSIRTCAIVVKKDASNNPTTEYYVGTSVGLYSTAGLSNTFGAGGTIVWSREGPTVINYAVVQSIDYRPEDNTLLFGTHGNGMFYTMIGSSNFTPNLPTAIASSILNDKNFVTVYPTVSNGNYHYAAGNLNGIKSMTIQVFNMLGQPLYRSTVNYGSGNIAFSNAPAGNYVIQIISDNKKYQTLQKIIKQ